MKRYKRGKRSKTIQAPRAKVKKRAMSMVREERRRRGWRFFELRRRVRLRGKLIMRRLAN